MAAYPPPPQQHQQQPAVEHGREPCPDRILDDIGGAFGMGALGGGAWHMYKGLKNSPKGYKLIGAIETVRRESPRIGGNFANWGLMFSVFDCTCLYVRKKEDPFNAIMAGALTGGFLQLRSGVRPALRSAVFGGVLLAVIEGLGITLSKMTSPPPPSMPMPPGMGPPGAGLPAGPPGLGGPELAGGELSTAPPPMPDLLGGGAGGVGLDHAAAGGGAGATGAAEGDKAAGGGGFWSWFGGGGGGGGGGSSGGDSGVAPTPTPVKEQVFHDEGFKHG
jgi:import inner membrane translocase subunit TIM17